MPNPILVLLPSLRRPEGLVAAIESLVSLGTGLADLLVIGGEYDGVIRVFNSVPHELLNSYKIIGLFGDDVRMRTPCWDAIVQNLLRDKTGLIYGQDGHQDQKLCTHPFVTMDIFRALGFLYPSCLHHYSGDNFLMELLRPLGMIRYCPEIFTEHLHPDAGRAVVDDTYRRSRRWWDADLAAWASYRQTNLALDRQRVADL